MRAACGTSSRAADGKLHDGARGHGGAPAGAGQRAPQVARGFGAHEQFLGQRDVEIAFEPREQLHAREAIEPELAVERAVEADALRARLAAVNLGDERLHHPQHLLGGVVGARGRVGHRLHHRDASVWQASSLTQTGRPRRGAGKC